jgi:polysaccharide export outer membrane protein
MTPQSRIMPPDGATASSNLAEINRALASAATQTPAASADYRIGPQDMLQITLFNIPEAEGRVTPRTMAVRVSQQGVIMLPLLGEIPVAGLTVADLERTLQERYDKYIHDPQVGVLITEYRSQRISVIGAVQSPGVFELSGPKTLIDLLAMSGGVSDKAGSQVHLYRQGPEGRQSYVIDLYALTDNAGSLNLPVQAGDVINVPKAGMFFVEGAVGRPGSYPLDYPYTLTQAITAAGGVNKDLAGNTITIFRHRGPGEVETVPVNLGEIMAGELTDLQVQASDVIVVPISTPKYIVSRVLSTISMGMGIYLNPLNQ